MTTAFHVADDTLFADPHLGEDCVYLRAGGSAVTVRCVVTFNDPVHVGLAGIDVSAPGTLVAVSRAVVPVRPTELDTFTVRGVVHRVRQVTTDALGLEWHCDVYPVG